MRILTAALVVSFVVTGAARADVLHVPKDFPTIQDAVDAAVPQDEIVIAAGSYDEEVVIAGKSELSLRGQGKVVITGGEVLVASLLVDSSTNIRLERLRFEGVPGDAISVVDSAGVTVTRCRVDDCGGAGVRVVGCEIVVLERNVVDTAGAFGLRAQNVDVLVVRKCSVRVTVDNGVSVEAAGDVEVERVRVEDAGGNSIELLDVDSSVVRDSFVRNPSVAGISVGGSDTLITDNRMVDVGENSEGVTCITLGAVIRGNRVVGGSFGMNIGGDQVQVLDNRVVKAKTLGLALGGSAPLVVSGNRVLKTVGTGISLPGNNHFSVLTDNTVLGAAQGIALFADQLHVAGNRVGGVAGNGFAVHGVGCLLTGNTAKGSEQFDLFDDSLGSNTYVDNDFGQAHFE